MSVTNPRPVPARAGIGLRAEHHAAMQASLPDVGWLEVHSENHFAPAGAAHRALDALREHYPLSLHGVGLELDAIAAVVIGGTSLRGGVGYVLGSFVGVMILGLIQTLIAFNGTLSSWWTRIVIGVLLLVFCLLQRLLEARAGSR